LLLSNSLADNVFDPPTSLGFKCAPPIGGIFPVAKLDAGIDVCFYILASLFEGCFRDLVAQLSGFYGGSRSDRTVRQCPHCRLDFVPQETVIPEARILDDEQCNGRESGAPAPCRFLGRSNAPIEAEEEPQGDETLIEEVEGDSPAVAGIIDAPVEAKDKT
jgi:hypothetical protein